MSRPLLTPLACKNLENTLFKTTHNTPSSLMEQAGTASWNTLKALYPEAKSILVFAGTGNNAGDGLVLARLAQNAGAHVQVVMQSESQSLPHAAHLNFEKLNKNIFVSNPTEQICQDADVIVDAIFGIGLNRPLNTQHSDWVQIINQSHKPVVALDIPSGLCALTGKTFGTTVKATHTITFLQIKTGLVTNDGPEHAGQIHVATLDVPLHAMNAETHHFHLLDYQSDFKSLKRHTNTHKAKEGRIGILGGSTGFTGALFLTGQATLRAGGGMVTLLTRGQHTSVINLNQPELMVQSIESLSAFKDTLKKLDVLAIGPGLGQSPWAESLFLESIRHPHALVLDADALNLLAKHPTKRHNWVLTPHPGEAARLLGVTTEQIQADRYHAVKAIQKKYGGVVILKGCGTLICHDSQNIFVCSHGNPWMATPGMGDALTGILTAFIGQKMTLLEASKNAVLLHSHTADRLQLEKNGVVLASDVIQNLRLT